MKINRLDPEYLKTWRRNHRDIFDSFVADSLPLFDAIDCLRHLHFKDDALKAEWISLEREKNKPGNMHRSDVNLIAVS